MTTGTARTRSADGVVTVASPYPFTGTLARIERTIAEHGLTVFARIDHREGARREGLDMQEATVLVFGNPRVGTPAMLEQPLLALDLPLRVLVWKSEGQARVSYQEPDFVGRRFAISTEVPAHAEALVKAALA